MVGKIRHIGKEDSKAKYSRYKRLVNSGIFRDKKTTQKVIDCKGDFISWTNKQAKEWMMARVKELNDDRDIDISCDCCTTTDENILDKVTNQNCFATEIIEIIRALSIENSIN